MLDADATELVGWLTHQWVLRALRPNPLGAKCETRRTQADRSAQSLLRTPIWFYCNGFGWLFGHRLAYIVHIGRKSGLRREVVAEVVRHDPNVPEIVVVAAWGREPDWYRNLKAAPAVEIRISGQRWEGPTHRFLGATDTLAVLRDYRRAHPHAWKRIAPVLGLPVDLDTEAVPDAHAIAFTR